MCTWQLSLLLSCLVVSSMTLWAFDCHQQGTPPSKSPKSGITGYWHQCVTPANKGHAGSTADVNNTPEDLPETHPPKQNQTLPTPAEGGTERHNGTWSDASPKTMGSTVNHTHDPYWKSPKAMVTMVQALDTLPCLHEHLPGVPFPVSHKLQCH